MDRIYYNECMRPLVIAVAVAAGAQLAAAAWAGEPDTGRDSDRRTDREQWRYKQHRDRGQYQQGATRPGDPNPYASKAGAPNPYATQGGTPNPYATRGGDPEKPLTGATPRRR